MITQDDYKKMLTLKIFINIKTVLDVHSIKIHSNRGLQVRPAMSPDFWSYKYTVKHVLPDPMPPPRSSEPIRQWLQRKTPTIQYRSLK
jgi:hypothetical protein